ncbi:hypothetical protein [Paenibacillus sp. V4I7]|uniref:hypothetical protein n=1 Tax=Paenibacillus sp. V4I7 TaxID=3042307 RepID=UPI00277D97CE|nr:hypothetical protein [Paenibacillus sp. V4I7]MDQ0898969.1 hypothetical protein [Paenibacillus sp. V4I7]
MERKFLRRLKKQEHEDGSATIWMSEIDRMFGTLVSKSGSLRHDHTKRSFSQRFLIVGGIVVEDNMQGQALLQCRT